MQLNAVVLPAPLGPISPTISHSLTARLSPSMAVRPPKRMVRSRTSSTDITTSGQSSGGGITVLVVQRETMPCEPLRERTQHLPQTTGVEDDRLQQQARADDVGDVGLVVGVEVQPSRVVCDARKQRVDQREERGRGNDAGAVAEAPDDDHHDEDECLVEAGRRGEVLVGELL